MAIECRKTEYILQLSHLYEKGLTLDVGFYRESYKIYVIYDYDWEKPKEVFESSEARFIMKKMIRIDRQTYKQIIMSRSKNKTTHRLSPNQY